MLVNLNGEYPSSFYVVPQLDLPRVNEIKNLIVNLGFILMVFRFSKLFVVCS